MEPLNSLCWLRTGPNKWTASNVTGYLSRDILQYQVYPVGSIWESLTQSQTPSLLPHPSSAKVLVIGGGLSGPDIVNDLLSPFISQVIHPTSTPPTVVNANPRLTNRPRLSQFFTDSNSAILLFPNWIFHLTLHSRNWIQVIPCLSEYFRPSIRLLYPSTRYFMQQPFSHTANYLFSYSGTAHIPNIGS